LIEVTGNVVVSVMSFSLGFLCLSCLVHLLSATGEAVVFVVDPIWDCVESYVANVPLLQKYKIIKVMINPGKSNLCGSDHADIYMNITYNSFTPNDVLAAEEVCPKLRSLGFPVSAVIGTFDTAGALQDRLAACVGVRGNPSEGPLAHARFDKWAMSEAVRKAGLRSVTEKLVATWSEAKEYLESLNPPVSHARPVIFKILKGSSGIGVTKVYSLGQAEAIFSGAVGSTSRFGESIGSMLIQEFLQGKEYVVDSVSRDGVHKIVTVWYEDLRSGEPNYPDNLYYGFKMLDPKDWKTKVIMEYANKVLDATGIRNGASDLEIFWLEEEGAPCVVDVNARWTALMWHYGLDLERASTGYDQITATANAYLDGNAFNEMPLFPSISQFGAVVFAQPHHTGILTGMPGLAVTKKLPSYFGSYVETAVVGKPIRAIDGGHQCSIVLANRDKAVVDADYDRIVALVDANAFYDITPSTGYASLTSLRPSGGLPGHLLPAIATLAVLAVAAVVALAAMSRRNVRSGTEYLIIE